MTTYTSVTDRIRAENPGLSDPEVRQLVKQEIRRRKHRREVVYNVVSKVICAIFGTIAAICAIYGLGSIIMMLLNHFIFT